MTDTSAQGVRAQVPAQGARSAPEATGWVGWIVFGSVMMIILGTFHAIDGLVALLNDEYFIVGKSGLIVEVDFTTWGWVHLALGVVMVLAAFSLLASRMWARIAAVILAGVSAVVNLGFLAANPVWSTIMIALDVIVIYAVTVHGREAGAF
jgi:hypothetical protein